MTLNPHQLFLFGNILSLLLLKGSFSGCSIGWHNVSCSILSISSHCWPVKFLLWNPPVALWKLPCLWRVTFLLLSEFCFWLSDSSTHMCLDVAFFIFFLSSVYLGPLGVMSLMCIFFLRFGKFSTIIIYQTFWPFLSLSLHNELP